MVLILVAKIFCIIFHLNNSCLQKLKNWPVIALGAMHFKLGLAMNQSFFTKSEKDGFFVINNCRKFGISLFIISLLKLTLDCHAMILLFVNAYFISI